MDTDEESAALSLSSETKACCIESCIPCIVVELIAGSSGLIGSEVACCFDELDTEIQGIDNNQRTVFFVYS